MKLLSATCVFALVWQIVSVAWKAFNISAKDVQIAAHRIAAICQHAVHRPRDSMGEKDVLDTGLSDIHLHSYTSVPKEKFLPIGFPTIIDTAHGL